MNLRRIAIVALVVAACPALASAQNVYAPGVRPGGWGGAWNPWGGGFYPGRVGGALMGQADVLRASGEVMVQQQQANIEQQKAYQEKMVTQKKAFEQMMWEKANTATLTETLKFDTQLSMARMMSSPTPAEITNGTTLNAMLPLLKQLALQGIQGPPFPLDPNQLRQINVTIGKGGANVGMLTQPKRQWPLILSDSKYKDKTEAMVQQATSAAAMGTLDLKTFRELNSLIANATSELRTKFHREEISGGEFLDGKRFLDSLQTSVTALRDPSAQRMLDGTYSAQGSTVSELVANMTKSGLSFAPGNPGSESAYIVTHNLFVAYTRAAQAAAGITVQYMPPRTEAFANK